ncbi:VOC family protein [Congregibacter variabilis]|uniref:VOC family protein n=1 Tax=Congregibacter variabilis TaxID=3081200 RepID=A0ABZ0I4J2_9GAMM|nr:VOC family protein [Congregibacter sp. IMCC43200]
MQLNQVTLPVHDLPAANAFYLSLGFRQIVDSPRYARFECPDGGATFSLSLEETAFSNGAVIYFEHERLEEWVDSLQRAGVTFDQLPREESYLWTEAVLRDPSGNKIKLYRAGDNRRFPPWRVDIVQA